jgi:hypothetical protein
MLTQEQQDALSGSGAYAPSLPPPSGSTFRPFPGEMGRPGSIMPSVPVSSSPGSMGIMSDFLLIALLGMLG